MITKEQILNSTDFLKWIKELDIESKILKKINSKYSNDYLNIIALYYEVQIGYLLKKQGFKVLYEKDIDKKRPDWIIEKNNQKIILEVKNLNTNRDDLERENFETKLRNEIEKIKGHYYVSLKFDSTLKSNKYLNKPINEIISAFSLWIENKSESDKKFEFSGINIEIIKTNPVAEKIVVGIGNISIIRYDTRRIKSALKEKLDKYSKIIGNDNFGFIIAIVSKMTNGANIKDVKNIVYTNPISEEIGFFEQDLYKDKINGVIWMRTCDDNFTYLPNNNNSEEINKLF